jgi:hypothetical protein
MSIALTTYDGGALAAITAYPAGSVIADGRWTLLGFGFGPNPCSADGRPEGISRIEVEHLLAPEFVLTWDVVTDATGWGQSTAKTNEGFVNCA